MSNVSVKHVQDVASKKWRQTVRIKKPNPTVWTPNATYQFEIKTKSAVSVVTTEMERAWRHKKEKMK
jgi:hypothetical protein